MARDEPLKPLVSGVGSKRGQDPGSVSAVLRVAQKASTPEDCLKTTADLHRLKRVRHDLQSAESVPDTEGHAQESQNRRRVLEVPSDRAADDDKAKGGRENRHRDGGPGGEGQERTYGVGPIGDGREQQQRQTAGATDPMHEPDTVGAYGRPGGDGVGVFVGGVFSVRVDVAVVWSVAVAVDVEEAVPPLEKKPDGEEHDDRAT